MTSKGRFSGQTTPPRTAFGPKTALKRKNYRKNRKKAAIMLDFFIKDVVF
jgi:hypothetical protein